MQSSFSTPSSTPSRALAARVIRVRVALKPDSRSIVPCRALSFGCGCLSCGSGARTPSVGRRGVAGRHRGSLARVRQLGGLEGRCVRAVRAPHAGVFE
jgi:hypothetical protein